MSRYWITYVGQVQAGAYAHGLGEFGGQCSMSTYGSIEQLLSTHAAEIVDGAWIVDARGVSLDDAITESMSGPMPKSDLAPEDDEGAGPLDYVSEKTKAWRWARLGAKVSRWSANLSQLEPHDWAGWTPKAVQVATA